MTKSKNSASGILSSLLPKTIATYPSNINGEIKVQLFLGKYSVVVDNLTQSGGLVATIWQKVCSYLNKKLFTQNKPQKVLVLGLGAGSIISSLTATWPDCRITALELDPVMITIGKQYFGLNQYQNLRIINQDALSWLNTHQSTYDLICVDLYLGRQILPAAATRMFLESINSHLKPSGQAVFNHLILWGESDDLAGFTKTLTKVFQQCKTIPTPVNQLLLVAKVKS
jgi:spermidine synthase